MSFIAPSTRKVYWSPWSGVCSKVRLNLKLHKITQHTANKMLCFCPKSTVEKSSIFMAYERHRDWSPRKSRVAEGAQAGRQEVWPWSTTTKRQGLVPKAVLTTEGSQAETTTLFGSGGNFLSQVLCFLYKCHNIVYDCALSTSDHSKALFTSATPPLERDQWEEQQK